MAQEILNVGTSAGSGDGEPLRTGMIKTNNNFTELYASELEFVKVVNQSNYISLLSSPDDCCEYLIDGTVDLGTLQIEVPVGGLTIKGVGANISMLKSSEDSYTMFTSPVGGSGDLITEGLTFTVDGANSKLLEIKSATGFDVFSFSDAIWLDCASLGSIESYAQGLENVTTRDGGQPQLELIGNMVAGYKITTSNTRPMADGSFTLFKAGAGLLMNGRFVSDQSVNLTANSSFLDFSPSNFANPSALQLNGVSVARNGVVDPTDTNLTPNISNKDLSSSWIGCVGLSNTHVGGRNKITTEITTNIAVSSTYYLLAGTWTTDSLEHFDSPANGQLRHLGNTPREYSFKAYLKLDGGPNDEASIRVRKFKASDSSTSTVHTQSVQINSFQGGRDVGDMFMIDNIDLDQNDYIYLDVANLTDTSDITVELDSFYDVSER